MTRKAELLHPRNWWPPVAAICFLLVVWQVVAAHDHLLLPSLGSVATTLVHNKVTYLANAGDTLSEAVPGVMISYVCALVLAVCMNQSRFVMRAVLPLAIVLNVSPLIAIAPALGIVLGVGRAPRVVVTALITFFPVLINSLTGLRSADPGASEVFATLSASRWETLWRLQLPSSLPYLFAAARVVVPLSVVGAAISEMVTIGGGNGLGYYIEQWFDNAQLNYAWGGIAVLAAFGLLLTAAVVVAENKVLRWRGFR